MPEETTKADKPKKGKAKGGWPRKFKLTCPEHATQTVVRVIDADGEGRRITVVEGEPQTITCATPNEAKQLEQDRTVWVEDVTK